VDLDSDFVLASDSIYHIVASFDGETMLLFVNGKLNTFKPQTGSIRTSTLPLLIGQMLPTDAAYNYKGIMDEIKIFDYALHPNEVTKLYVPEIVSKIKNISTEGNLQIYPNPVDQTLFIRLAENDLKISDISIFDIKGQKLINKRVNGMSDMEINVGALPAGNYFLQALSDVGEIIQSIQFIKP
jgi:hypothetical protein